MCSFALWTENSTGWWVNHHNTTSNSLYLCIKRDSHCSKYQNLLLYYLYKEVFSFFQATDEESIVKLSETLSSKGIDHKLWIEQPENIPTCIATRPYVKENIQENFKKFKLFKAWLTIYVSFASRSDG